MTTPRVMDIREIQKLAREGQKQRFERRADTRNAFASFGPEDFNNPQALLVDVLPAQDSASTPQRMLRWGQSVMRLQLLARSFSRLKDITGGRDAIMEGFRQDIKDIGNVWDGASAVLNPLAEVGQAGLQLQSKVPGVSQAQTMLKAEEALSTASDYLIDPLLRKAGVTTTPTIHGPSRQEREDMLAMKTLSDITRMAQGKASIAETARGLRGRFEQREGMQQLVAGAVFDPANLATAGSVSTARRFASGIAPELKAAFSRVLRKPASILPETLPDGTLPKVTRGGGIEQPGVPNAFRRDPENVARGKGALVNRIGLEMRKGSVTAQQGVAANAFIDTLPDHMLADLGSTFTKELQFPPGAIGAVQKDATGFYDTGNQIINVLKGLEDRSLSPERVLIHEVSHHLEQFVPGREVRQLKAQFQDELRDRGQRLLSQADQIRQSLTEGLLPNQLPRTLTAEQVSKVNESYRFTNFEEWFAEVMTDKALRDAFDVVAPDKRGVIRRALDSIKDMASATYNYVLRRQNKDAAESVYQKIMRDQFDPAERRSLGERFNPLREASEILDAVNGGVKRQQFVETTDKGRAGLEHLKANAAKKVDKSGKTTFTATQDIAVVQTMRSTGARRGHALGLTVGSVRRYLDNNVPGLEFAQQTSKSIEADDLGDFTQQTATIPQHDAELRRTLAEYINADPKVERLMKSGADDAPFFPNLQTTSARNSFTTRYKGYAEGTTAPTLPRLVRRQVAQELLLDTDGDVLLIQRQLGHASPSVTRQSYLRELGMLLDSKDDELLESIKGSFSTKAEAEALADIRAYLGSDKGRRKGMTFKGGTLSRAAHTIGSALQERMPVSEVRQSGIEKASRIGMNDVDTVAFQALSTDKAKAEGLFRLSEKLSNIRASLVAQKKIVNNLKKSADDVTKKELTETAKELEERRKDVADLADTTAKRVDQENDRIGLATTEFRTKYGDKVDFDELGTAIGQPGQVASEAEKTAAFKRKKRSESRALRKALNEAGTTVIFKKTPLTAKGEELKGTVGVWLDDVRVFEYLRGTAKVRADMAPSEVKAALRRVQRNRPILLGEDFVNMSNADRSRRIEQISSAMFSDRPRMSKFKVVSPLDEAIAVSDDVPPVDPPKNLQEQSAPAPDEPWDDILPDATAGNPMALDDITPQVKVSHGDIANYVRDARPGSGTLRFLWTQVAGGWAPVLNEAGRTIAALKQGYDMARGQGQHIKDALAVQLRKAGVALERRDDLPGSTLFFSEDTIKVKKNWKNLEDGLRGTELMGDAKTHMRAWHVVLGEIHPTQWDEFYEMSPPVKKALLFARHQIKGIERVMNEATTKYGIDWEDHIQGDRVTTYFPRISIGKVRAKGKVESMAGRTGEEGPAIMGMREAELKLIGTESTTGIQQSRASNFMKREHDHYSGALRDFTKYGDELESLGYYGQTVHMVILEHQVRDAMLKSGLVVDLKSLDKTQSAAEAVKSVLVLTKEGEVPSTDLLQKAFRLRGREWLDKAMQDPDSFMRQAEAGVRRAEKRDFQGQAMGERMKSSDIDVSYMEDLILTDEARKQVRALLVPEVGASETPGKVLLKLGETTAPITQVARLMKTGFDFGVGLLHLFPVMVTKPRLWAKANKEMVKALINPTVYQEWRVANADLIARSRAKGVVYGQAEPLEMFDRGEYFARIIRGVGRMADEAGQATVTKVTGRPASAFDAHTQVGLVERFEAVFSMPLDYARANLYESFEQVYGHDDTAMSAVAAMVNKMTGTYNSNLSGVTPNMRAVQTGLLFFAPLYRRASYGLMRDVFSTDPIRGTIARDIFLPHVRGNGNMAQKIFGNMTMAATMGVYASWLSHFTATNGRLPEGEEWGNAFNAGGPLDPRTPKFMGVQVGNFNMGLGTAYYSIARLGSGAVTGALGAYEDDNEPFSLRKVTDNFMFKWLRGQLAPTTAAGMDLAVGRTFVGEPLRGEGADMKTFLKWGVEQVLPFWGGFENINAMQRNDISGYAASIGEFVGLRSFPLSVFSKADAMRDEIIEYEAALNPEFNDFVKAVTRDIGSVPKWSDMSSHWKAKLTEKHPALSDVDEMVRQHDMRTGDALDKHFISYGNAVSSARAQLSEMLEVALAELNSPTASRGPREFQSKMRDAKLVYRTLLHDAIARFPDVQAKLEEARTRKTEDGARFSGALAYDDYLTSVVLHPDNEDEFGNFRPETFEDNMEAWRARWGHDPTMEKFVENERFAGKNIPEAIRVFETEEKPKLDEYWNIHKTLFKEGGRDHGIIMDYLESEGERKNVYRETHPGARLVIRRWEKARERYRQSHPEVDWILVKWYGYSPRTHEALRKFNEEIRAPQGLPPRRTVAR